MTHSLHDFNRIASKPVKKREAPFSLRLSFEEKAALKEMAGDVPLTKHKTAWEKFTDAFAVFGLGVIGFVVICLIAAASGG